MPYKEFYNLVIEPFSNAPNARLYFPGPQHERTLAKLRYAVDNMKGLAVCTGDIGAGKTTLARRLLDSLPDKEFEAALLVIVHSGITANWLLKRIALQLGVKEPAAEKLALLSQLYRRLVRLYQEGKKAVVLIDETQMLKSRELMEEFRGLLNLEVPGRKLITFIFFGLDDLDDSLKIDEPLRQRVAVRTRLMPLDQESTGKYVLHRLQLAGATRTVFSSGALVEIHTCSRGIPRLINTLCDNALFEGALIREHVIGANLVRQVAEELGMLDVTPAQPSSSVSVSESKPQSGEESGDAPDGMTAHKQELETFDDLLRQIDND